MMRMLMRMMMMTVMMRMIMMMITASFCHIINQFATMSHINDMIIVAHFLRYYFDICHYHCNAFLALTFPFLVSHHLCDHTFDILSTHIQRQKYSIVCDSNFLKFRVENLVNAKSGSEFLSLCHCK